MKYISESKKMLKKYIYQIGFFTLAIVLIIILILYQKVVYLSANPEKDKDCPPLMPDPELASANKEMGYPEKNMQRNALSWIQKGGTINDASCLNKTSVYGVIEVKNEDDFKNALQYAKNEGLKISLAGARHSMGGQSFFNNNLVLDITKFNTIKLDEQEKTVTVQSGATWHQIQEKIHPKFAIKAMQSTDIFTVGGSISVNAHGMDHQVGSIAKSIRSLSVLLPDGTTQMVSPQENPDLFWKIVGGYGLFGMILEAKLDVTDNLIYDYKHKIIDYKDFPRMFAEEIDPDKNIGLMYAHLSTAPSSFLKETLIYTYKKSEKQNLDIPPLTEVGNVPLRRFVINLAKTGFLAQELKWFTEKHLEPLIQTCLIDRNNAIKSGEACLVSRNEPMHDSVKYLKNDHPDETDILHEYFIPRSNLITFIDGMREIMEKNKVNLLNASIRVVHKEDTFLNYAPQESFSVVLYINQKTDTQGNAKMKKVTEELIDLSLKNNGRFFLPYQLYYTPAQLKASYPEINDFFEAKRQIDPQGILTNTFYERFGTIGKI